MHSDQAVIFDIANNHMHQNITSRNDRYKRKMQLGISRVGIKKWIGYLEKKFDKGFDAIFLDIYTGQKIVYHNWTSNALDTFNVLSKRTDLGIILQIFEDK